MLSLFALSLIIADPAVATQATAPAEIKEAAKEPRKICKRETVSTSLHGSKRVCMTADEWKQREKDAEYSDMGSVTTK